jgi:HSP20 family protein
MAIARWAPFAELDSLERRMRRLLEDAGFAPALAPAADVYETEDEYVVELEVPGYEEQELSIEVTDHVLTIRGEQTKDVEETKRSYRLHERLERRFERQFPLPAEADADAITADFTKGVLVVHAKRAPTVKAKQVPIEPRK